MPDRSPPSLPDQTDNIPTIHINIPSCYLQPAGSVVPELPDGTYSYDALENYWKPSPSDSKRQEFRIQCKNEIVFIAGAQYTYKPNTSLHIKCKKATFMPHPTDPSQKTVIVRMPGADAEQNLLAKAEEGKRGTKAKYRFECSEEPVTWDWDKFLHVLTTFDEATRGGNGMGGAIGSQGADAGSLTIEADSYDTAALPDDKVFFIADCTGGRGQQGGEGGDGGSGGDGTVIAGINKSEHQAHTGKGIHGAKGGNGGRQGAGGYGGSGGQFTINLPKSAGDDKLKARFSVRSSVGTPGATGAAGKPGPGGGCGQWRLFKCDGERWSTSEFLKDSTNKDQLMAELISNLELDWSSQPVWRWAAGFIGETALYSVIGDVPKALDEQEIRDLRAHAGQHEPMTCPNVVFKEVDKP